MRGGRLISANEGKHGSPGGSAVDGEVLRQFLRGTRIWSHTHQGNELFLQAAKDLACWAEIDGGFFVYQKRDFSHERVLSKPDVYQAWGPFKETDAALRNVVEQHFPALYEMIDGMERWIPWDNLKDSLRQAWDGRNIAEFGVWPLISGEKPIGALVVARTSFASNRLTPETRMAIVDACAAQIALGLDLILATRAAEEASEQDLLTGLLNRRGLLHRYPSVLNAAKTAKQQVVVGILDLNHLKRINDSQGHPAGDEALRRVAVILGRKLRNGDLLARWGGDEFAVVMRVDNPDVKAVMDRLKQAVANQSEFSVGAGGALWGTDGDTWDACYRVADARLYHDKQEQS